jgi:uncharacterized protein YqjF (DUF2071 family)
MRAEAQLIAGVQRAPKRRSHRDLPPHPIPDGAWVMQQQWHDLLFAHWSFPIESIRALIPPSLEVDTFDGTAWVGVIPFSMTGVRVRGAPPVPTAHSFAELNVRTYVIRDGKPGVWFFSLDAASTLAVIGARLGARLPYFRADISITRGTRWIDYRSERWSIAGPASFHARYAPRPALVPVKARSLDFFLTERYALHSSDGDSLYRAEIHHPRWRLTEVDAEIGTNSMIAAAGLARPAGPPVLHFSACQDVRFWWPVRVA